MLARIVKFENSSIENAQVARFMREEIAGLRKALHELAELGEQGMKPDYREWLTFHDKVAQVARKALGSQANPEAKSVK